MVYSTIGIFSKKKLSDIQEIMGRKDNPNSIAQLTNYVAEVKSMNIAKSKELVEMHVNLATSVKEIRERDKNYSKCQTLEHDIIIQT